MGKFAITSEQRAELKQSDATTPVPIMGADGQNKAAYHNPVTGREIRSLADAYHMTLRLRQGWRLGPASPELREKWAIREKELLEEDDRRVAEYVASNEHQESEKTRFTEAVAAAVAQALENLNIDLPGKGAEKSAPAPVGKQLSLFVPTDAPSESETQHVVSQASRPDLHLVE